MTKSTITRERLEQLADNNTICKVSWDERIELAQIALAAMDQKPALHRYRRKAIEPYGHYPWHYEVFVDYPRPVEGIEDEYFYAAPPVVTGFAVDGEPAENHIGSKNALDAIVSFIKSKSNPTVKCYEEVYEQLLKDNCHGIHSHVIEYILKLGEELEDFRAEQAEMQPASEYPKTLPCPVLLEPGLRFGKGIKTSTMLAALARRAVYESDMAALSQEEKAEFQARIEDFKALIAHPVPVVPQDVLEALQKVARIRLDMNDFDGDRRGIADCLCDAEEALIEVVNRRAAMLAAAPQEVK